MCTFTLFLILVYTRIYIVDNNHVACYEKPYNQNSNETLLITQYYKFDSNDKFKSNIGYGFNKIYYSFVVVYWL